jgi:hypothetical protein
LEPQVATLVRFNQKVNQLESEMQRRGEPFAEVCGFSTLSHSSNSLDSLMLRVLDALGFNHAIGHSGQCLTPFQ